MIHMQKELSFQCDSISQSRRLHRITPKQSDILYIKCAIIGVNIIFLWTESNTRFLMFTTSRSILWRAYKLWNRKKADTIVNKSLPSVRCQDTMFVTIMKWHASMKLTRSLCGLYKLSFKQEFNSWQWRHLGFNLLTHIHIL